MDAAGCAERTSQVLQRMRFEAVLTSHVTSRDDYDQKIGGNRESRFQVRQHLPIVADERWPAGRLGQSIKRLR